ncbi:MULTISPECIES: hypothetical protein [Spirosoma]|uniref:Uncharacterized protein n=1 Tax=Spirosoma liriopis TaxID=2937440 RepID=A0ABT0HNE2_9BACT|nr:MULTISPECIES: hypothetical protein [Spirosoma]MCK8493689.1 hypothetical protein [Spirosoma liriopis]UHG93095.1 hypothetical protein LQ777_09375 [Spirosoma oryzicola]
MKAAFTVLISLGLLAFAVQTQAQDERKLRKDPTYSTHNYKHANKAATARRWESNAGVAVQQPSPADARLADYKKSVPNAQPAGGITVDHTPSMSLADRNYKIQRVSEPNNSDNNSYVKQRRQKSDSSSVIGND